MGVTLVSLLVLSELFFGHRAIPDISLVGHAFKHFLEFLIHSLHQLLNCVLLSFLTFAHLIEP